MDVPVPKLLLSYVTDGNYRDEFVESLLKTLTSDIQIGVQKALSGPLISRARNLLAENFLTSPVFTHMLFVDCDMVWDPDHVKKLIEADKPIVSGLYYGLNRETGEKFPTALMRWDDGSYRPLHRPPKGLKKVDGVGMGLTLIKREVLEALKPDAKTLWPFAETVIDGRALGEDLTFCLRAKQEGFDTWVHGDARVGHVKSVIIL